MNIYILKKREIDISNYLKIMKKYNFKVVEDIRKANLIFIFGGDGMVLKVIKHILIKNIPILAINHGKLGYLASISQNNFETALKKIISKKYKLDKRKLLEIKIYTDDFHKKYYALNDVCIIKGNIMSKLIEINAFDTTYRKEFITKYRADGLIISTPTGSTAYSLSSGGSILYKNLDALILTAICPQTLTAVPIVINGDRKLEFSFNENKYREVLAHIDGYIHVPLTPNSVIKTKLSNKYIELININDNNYYDILREKLNWGKNIVE